MPFVANTPESLIGRADSKNPNSTCRGITSSGRPCRRALATQPGSLQPPSRRPRTPDPRDESLYCWQHKEQASMSARSSPGPRATATPILEEPRTSLDTLADRLGLVDIQDKPRRQNRKKRPSQAASDYTAFSQTNTQANGQGGGKPGKKKGATLQCCFCFTVPLEELEKPAQAPARPQPRPVQRPTSAVPSPNRKSKQHLSAASAVSAASPSRSSRKSNASQTAQFKDLIPDTIDTVTASALLTELARPYVDSEESGYIYMFWLAPTGNASLSTSAPGDAARDLLAPPSTSSRSRRASDVVSAFADSSKGPRSKKTMVLKIGRAANVQRRMNQWQRQCGRDVEVLRFYPFTPSASNGSAPPRPTPHAHRVERLIHIELAGMGLRAEAGTCDACGKDHREWFQIEASRDAVREVDAVIRRWVEWDESV